MNNYDKSSSGENIEFNVSFDTDLARMYFKEWRDGLTGENVEKIDLGGRDNYLYLIGDSGQPYYKKSELNKLSKAALFELWLDYELGYDVDITDFKKADYIDDLLSVSVLNHYKDLATQYSWNEMCTNCPHDSYISRGYCQRDAVLVVRIDGLNGAEKKYIDNLLWDCPIYISISVNDEEVARDYDLLDDQYVWDIGLVKSNIRKLNISEYAKKFICDNLPEYPEYN